MICILCEKPIANTLCESIRIADKVKKANQKMGVTLSHKFDQDKTTLRSILRSQSYGELDYIICSLSVDRRKYGSWRSSFRYEMPDVQMIESGPHYFDLLADLADSKCEEIYTQTIILDHRNIEVLEYDPNKNGNKLKPGQGKKISLIQQKNGYILG